MYATSEVLDGDEYRTIIVDFDLDYDEIEITDIEFEDDGKDVPDTLYTEKDLQGFYDSCHDASFDDWTSGR